MSQTLESGSSGLEDRQMLSKRTTTLQHVEIHTFRARGVLGAGQGEEDDDVA